MGLDFDWLENEVFLHVLNENEKKLLDEIFEIIDFDIGDDLVPQDSTKKEMLIIREGTASVTSLRGGEKVHLGWVETGAIIGNMSFFSGQPATATVRAMGSVRVYKMDHQAYCKLLVVNQGLLVSLLAYMQRHMAEIIGASNQHIVSIVAGKELKNTW